MRRLCFPKPSKPKPNRFWLWPRAKGVKIATAESCTGGLIAGALTEISGSSDVVDRGYVTYSNTAKMDLLGVPKEMLETCGAVSQEVAQTMATGALQRSDAQIALSVTCIAGPTGGTADKPVGLVHVACAYGPNTDHQELRFGDIGREAVRMKTVDAALDLLARHLS